MQGRKLNILIFNTWAVPIGGSQYSTLAIAQQLLRRGHKVIYASNKGTLVEIMRRDGIKHYDFTLRRFIPTLTHFSVRSIIKLIKVLKREQIDCIHCFHFYTLLTAYVGQLFTGVPCVYTILGPLWTDPANQKNIPLHEFHGQIIAVCEEFKDQAVDMGSKANNITIIRNRIDLERYHPGIDTSEMMLRFGLKNDSKKIVMVTRFDGHKINAILHLLDAIPSVIKQFPQVQVLIVGDGEHFCEIQQRAKELNQRLDRTTVILTGALFDIPQILNLADVVIGVGRSVLEGMACQKPAIVVGTNGFAGIVQSETVDDIAYFNFAGRNVPGYINPDRLAGAIVKILMDDEYARSLGEFSRRFIEEEFDVKRGAERIEKIYMDVIRDKFVSKWQARLLLSLIRILVIKGRRFLLKLLTNKAILVRLDKKEKS